MKQKQRKPQYASYAEWIPLSTSLSFMLRRKKLLGWSFLIVLITFALTWVGYLITIDFLNDFTGHFLTTPPATDTIFGWIKHAGWVVGSWMFLLVSRIVAFYLAFLLAYSLTTPGYAFLSTAVEKLYAGDHFDPDANFTFVNFLIDIFEGIKIAFFGILVTIVALFVNFIPFVGQLAVFLLYTYYSALMFIDYPASRRHWSLRKKLSWLQTNSSPSFRLGILPALVSMIPLINIFAIALLFPLLTIHATLNFSAIEQSLLSPDTPQSTKGEIDGKRN